LQPAIDWPPGLAAVISPESPGRRDGDVNTVRVLRIKKDGVQSHATRSRLPKMTFGTAQTGQLFPGFPAVHRLEDRSVFHAGVGGIGIRQCGLDMPDSFEFPRML